MRGKRVYLMVLLAVVAVLSVQCGPGKKEGEANVAVIDNPEQPKEGIYNLDVKEIFTLGGNKDNSKYLFTRIRNIETDKEGHLYVLDYGSKIFIFDKEGKYIKQFGRNGSGPGEFKMNTDFAITSDSRIVIADPVNYRYSYFDLTGRYLSMKKTKTFLNNIQLDGYDNIYSFYSDYDKSSRPVPGKSSKMKLISSIYKYSKDSDVENLVGEFRGAEEKITVRGGGVNSDGFINEFVWKVSPKNYIITGNADTYLFSKYSLDGKLIGQFGRKYTRIPDRNSKGGADDSPFLPVFTKDSFFDDEGNLWVNLNYGDKPEYYIYDIFSPDGIFQKQIWSKYPVKKIKGEMAYSVVKSDEGEMLVKAFKYTLSKKNDK